MIKSLKESIKNKLSFIPKLIRSLKGSEQEDFSSFQNSIGDKFIKVTKYTGMYILNSRGIGNQLSKYLWVLDKEGCKIVREQNPFPLAERRRIVRHTNLTGGGNAYFGGEVWFLSENKVRVNVASRDYGYGHPTYPLTQYEYDKAIEFWRGIGYEVEVVPLGER